MIYNTFIFIHKNKLKTNINYISFFSSYLESHNLFYFPKFGLKSDKDFIISVFFPDIEKRFGNFKSFKLSSLDSICVLLNLA